MSKVKTAFWVIIFGFIALVFFQNQEFFMARQSIRINLLFTEYNTPVLPGAIFFAIFFLAGLFIAYFFGLPERFKLKKEIKKLNISLADAQRQKAVTTIQEMEPVNDMPVVNEEEKNESVL